MKLNIKSKILSLFLCGCITAGSIVPIITQAVYADEIDPSENETETVADDLSQEDDTNEEDIVNEETVDNGLEEDLTNGSVFNWDDYDKATKQIDGNKFTVPSDGTYELTLSANVIDDFDDDCYVYLQESEHLDVKIRIDLYPEDNFEKTIYLPIGYYQLIEYGAKNSPTLSFKTTAAGVSLNEESKGTSISIVLNNAGNVKKNELGVWEDKLAVDSSSNNTNTKVFGVEALEGIQSDVKGILYYTTAHSGAKKTRLVEKEVEVRKEGQTITEIQQVEEVYYEDPGPGYVTPYGSATKEADVVLLISRGGVVGQAEFKVSYDGGQTFTARYSTGDNVLDSNINLTYNFYALNDTDEFVEGDRFTFHSLESFEVKNSQSSENTRISCIGHPSNNHELTISVLSSGGRGISRIKISDKKNSLETKTYLIPSDGILVLDDNLTIYFENVDGYIKGVEYTISIKSNDTTVDYTPLIWLCVGLVVAAFIGLFWLLMKKDKVGDYIVHQYDWKQDESVYK